MSNRSKYVFGAALASITLGGVDSLVKKAHAAVMSTGASFTFETSYNTFFPSTSAFATKTSSSAGNTKYTVTTGTNTGYSVVTASSIGAFSAESGTGSAFGVHASASTAWSTPAGNGSVHSLSSDHWGVNDYYQFNVSTAGLSSLVVSFDATGSATGPGQFALAYSSDGSNFSTFASYSIYTGSSSSFSTSAANALDSYSFDLSGVTALNNLSTAYFRMVETGTSNATGGAIGTAGTSRVDNFTVAGAVPEPASLSIITVAGMAALARRRNKR